MSVAGSARRRGSMLLELLLAGFLLAAASVMVFSLLAQGRRMRGAAEERSRMALVAQTHLDRLAALPAGERRAAAVEAMEGAYRIVPTVSAAAPGWEEVKVTIERMESIEGTPPVALVTLLPAAGGSQ